MVDHAIRSSETVQAETAARDHPSPHETRLLLLWVAAWVASCDLTLKVIEPTQPGLYHRRTMLELLAIVGISAVTAYLVPLTRSLSIAIGAGFMVGGGVGNALSIVLFSPGVPNPLTVSRGDWTIAFNLADIGVAVGFVLMTVGIWRLASERSDELRDSVNAGGQRR